MPHSLHRPRHQHARCAFVAAVLYSVQQVNLKATEVHTQIFSRLLHCQSPTISDLQRGSSTNIIESAACHSLPHGNDDTRKRRAPQQAIRQPRSQPTRIAMSLSIPNAPNAGLFKGGYNKYVQPTPSCSRILPGHNRALISLCPNRLLTGQLRFRGWCCAAQH